MNRSAAAGNILRVEHGAAGRKRPHKQKRTKTRPRSHLLRSLFFTFGSLYFDSADAGTVFCRFSHLPIRLRSLRLSADAAPSNSAVFRHGSLPIRPFAGSVVLPVRRRHLLFRLGKGVAQIRHHGQDLGDMRRILVHIGLRDLVVEEVVQRL